MGTNSQRWGEKFSRLWEEEGFPFSKRWLEGISNPWELLSDTVLTGILGEAHGFGQRISFRGLLNEDRVVWNGQWLETKGLRLEGAEGVTKGRLRVLKDNSPLDGASWIQAGTYFAGEGEISIGRGVLVQNGAYIEGSTALGDRSEIRHGAFIRGAVLVGEGAVVGHTSEIKRAILFKGAKAAHFAYVGDSILGSEVNLGAGTKLANLKVTPGSIQVRDGADLIDTGMRKLGAVLGDHTETGCNSVLNPGVIMGKSCRVYPAVAVKAGLYSEGAWVTEKRGK